jgi:hypothetical protein
VAVEETIPAKARIEGCRIPGVPPGAKQAAEKGLIAEENGSGGAPQGLKPIDFIGFIGILRLRSGQALKSCPVTKRDGGSFSAACEGPFSLRSAPSGIIDLRLSD